jgi:hypothetical protein
LPALKPYLDEWAFTLNEDDDAYILQFRISLTVLGLSSTNFVYKASFNDLFVSEAASTEEFFISKYFKRNFKVQ